MSRTYTLQTKQHEDFYPITQMVSDAVAQSGIHDGICTIYCPHTTAGITINENADPHVVHDLLLGLKTAFPEQGAFLHMEGNSAAHLKAGCVGASETVIIQDGRLLLGTWQGIYFCEFDGPRTRKFHVQIIPSH